MMEKEMITQASSSDAHHVSTSGIPTRTLVGTDEVADVHDAVGFRTDGKVVDKDYDLPSEDMSLLADLHPVEEHHHSIEAYLSRPTKVYTLDWKAASKAGEQLVKIPIVSYLKMDAMSLFRQKLSGFYGFHARTHLKLTVNSMPFQAGMLHVYYVPFETSSTAVVAAFANSPIILPCTTGFPNVYLNLALQSEVELSIPYTGPRAFFNLSEVKSTDGGWGSFVVQTIVPIADSTNNATAEISIYLYFTDVKLFGASPHTFIPQGLREEEAETKSGGVISTLSGGGNCSQGGLSTALPAVLTALGLSKPCCNQSPNRMVLSPYANIGLGDSTSAALKLSMMAAQSVVVGNLGVDSHDECDIAYVVSKPCYYGEYIWKTSDVPGSRLFSLPVNPNCALREKVPSEPNLRMFGVSRLRYVAQCFRYWRGSIKYTIHVIATKFHSGRLRLIYSLGGSFNTPVGLTFPYTYSEIIDIRDGFCFQVVVPYIASTAWRRVPNEWEEAGPEFQVNYTTISEDNVPRFEVYVENQSVVSSQTNSNIRLAVFVSGGEDIEFAAPTRSKYLPAHYLKAGEADRRNIHEKPFDSDDEPNEIEEDFPGGVPQETPTRTRRQIFESVYGPLNPPSDGVWTPQGEEDVAVIHIVSKANEYRQSSPTCSTLTIGESVVNIRYLLRRYFPDNSFGIPKGESKYIVYYPWTVIRPAFGPVLGKRYALGFDFYSYFFPMYRFFRGGMRVLVRVIGNPDFRCTLKYDPVLNFAPEWLIADKLGFERSPAFSLSGGQDKPDENFINQASSVTIPFSNSLQGGLEVELPYYNTVHKSLTNRVNFKVFDDIKDNIKSSCLPEGALLIQLDTNNSLVNHTVDIFRAPADDFNFGFLLGAPLVAGPILNFTS